MRTREELLEQIPKFGIGAEIGVFEGDFSKLILSTVRPTLLYLVDIFEGPMMSADKNGDNMKYIQLEIPYKALLEKYRDMRDVRVIKSTSEFFFRYLVVDNYLDFVYIDADHNYNAVKSDLSYARKKVKPGGYISGHDYCEAFPGTVQAVNEFVQEYSLELKLTTEDKCASYLIKNG